MEELWKLDAFEISKLFKKREVSAVEICQQTVSHIQNTNPKINAIVVDTFEEAKKTAKLLDEKLAKNEKLGDLAGVPVTVKVPVLLVLTKVVNPTTSNVDEKFPVVACNGPIITVDGVPVITSDEFVTLSKNVNAPAESSHPKNPTLAVVPSWYLNSIPLSLLSSNVGAVSPPNVKIGSSTVTVVELIVVVVPSTRKS